MESELRLHFENEGEYLDADELASFLSLFGEVCRYSAAVVGEIAPERVLADSTMYMQQLCARYNIGEFEEAPSGAALRIKKIEHNSPLEIWLLYNLSALILAVIISGGKVKIFGNTIEVKSLGSGIRSIREAFGDLPRQARLEKLKKIAPKRNPIEKEF